MNGLQNQATIYSIPPEILRLIFCDYVQPTPLDRDRLARVSRQWRQIILQTASLWTDVLLRIPYSPIRPSLDSLFRLWELQVSRAGSLLLDITYEIYSTKCTRDDKIRFLEFIRRICPFERWKSLSLNTQFLPAHEMQPNDSLHNLESLDLEAQPNLDFLNFITQTAVHLQHVTCYGHNGPYAKLLELPSSLTVHHYVGFDNVVHPNITKLDVFTIKDINLAIFPNIRHLKLIFLNFDEFEAYEWPNLERLEGCLDKPISRPYNTVTMSRLSHLIITGPDLSSFVQLVAPKLKTIQIPKDWTTSPSMRINPLAGMNFGRLNTDGRCSPLTLEIDIPWHFTSLSMLLHRWAKIETLIISIPSNLDCSEIGRMFGEGNALEGESVCPNLVTLRLLMGWDQKIIDVDNWRGIAKLVMEKRAGSSLRCIECTWRDGSQIVERVPDGNSHYGL